MAAFRDLTGQQYGILTVVSRAPKGETKGVKWTCLCECGATTLARADHLLSGQRTSCGCTRKLIFDSGQRFGRLTLLELAPKGPSSRTMWRCRCDCGEICVVSVNALQSGFSTSCGCYKRDTAGSNLRGRLSTKFKDLTGQFFGKLAVKYRHEQKTKRGAHRWVCECACGRTTLVATGALCSGMIRSCGCSKVLREVVRDSLVRQKVTAFVNNKRRTNPKFSLDLRIRSAIRGSLKREGICRTETTTAILAILGYTVEELRRHLQLSMPHGYTWDDFMKGSLHIDHIRALKHFDYVSINCSSFKEAWALSNLQLLTAQDNMRKGAKLDWSRE